MNIYKDIQLFTNYGGFYKKKDDTLSDELIKYIFEAQQASFVRGERYQIYEIEHLKKLILPHNNVMIELFQLTSEEFIEGLEKLQ